MNTTINGVTYQVGKLQPLVQFHVVRKLAPIMASVAAQAEGNLLANMIKPGGVKAMEGADVMGLLGPALQGLSDLSQEDADFVIMTCLRVVNRQQGPGFVPITAQGTGLMMFEDIDMAVMLQLVWAVMEHNLSGFFRAVPEDSPPLPA